MQQADWIHTKKHRSKYYHYHRCLYSIAKLYFILLCSKILWLSTKHFIFLRWFKHLCVLNYGYFGWKAGKKIEQKLTSWVIIWPRTWHDSIIFNHLQCCHFSEYIGKPHFLLGRHICSDEYILFSLSSRISYRNFGYYSLQICWYYWGPLRSNTFVVCDRIFWNSNVGWYHFWISIKEYFCSLLCPNDLH